MTTIGTAVLQIIPSLKGVSEAIEQQIDGKAVDIQIKPKVDQRATEQAAKQARETVEKQTTEVKVQPKVDTRAAEQAGKTAGEAVTKGATDAVESASTGKDIAKVLVDGIADGVKSELRGGPLVDEFVDGLADGVKQGIDQGGVSNAILSTIGDGLKSGDVGGTIRGAVLPAIKGIGTDLRASTADWSRGIADSLRGGDIQGATDSIGTAVLSTTDLIADIGDTFGLQTGGAREFAQNAVSSLSDVGGSIQGSIGKALELSGTFTDIGSVLESVLPGKAEKGMAGVQAAMNRVVLPVWLTALLGNELANKLDDVLPGEDHPDRDVTWAPKQGLTAPKRIWEMITGQRDPNTGELKNAIESTIPKGGPFGTGNGPHGRGPVTDPTGGLLSGPAGVVIGPDGKPIPIPGRSAGGYTGNFPIDQIAGVVHGGEFVIRKAATDRIQSAAPGLLDALNGYQGGGLVGPDVSVAKALAGTPYSQGNRTDCSGMVSRVILKSLGKTGGLMTTKNAEQWLSALGFRPGTGGPGAITVGWYDRGPNPNDGHMAMTLSDGTHAEAGGRNRVFTLGAGARGGDDSSFDRHMVLRLASVTSSSSDGEILGEGPAIGGIPAAADASSVAAAVLAGSSSSGGGVSLASSISGLAGTGLSNLGVTTSTQIGDKSQARTFDIGGVASSAIGGQVSSALGVFGVNDSPGWLQGISKFVSGISVSEKGSGKKIFDGSNIGGTVAGAGSLFGGAAPVPASAFMGPAPLPDGVVSHGAQAGQKPGPTVNYNIRTALTEDAFVQAQQQEKIRVASKIDRF